MKQRLRNFRAKIALLTAVAVLLSGGGGVVLRGEAGGISLVTEVSAATQDVFDLMRARWYETLIGETGASDDVTQELLRSRDETAGNYWYMMLWNTNPDQLFRGVDSTNNTGNMSSAYMMLRDMAIAYKTPGSAYYNNTSLRDGIISGLEFLYNTCYYPNQERFKPALQAPDNNWWDWEIGSPQRLNDIVVLMYDDLTEAQRTKYMDAVKFFMPNPNNYYFDTAESTGANRINVALVTALHGVITKDASRIKSAQNSLTDVLEYVTSGDGFYGDGSFIQHGVLPYNGGYGLGLLNSLASMVYLFRDSVYDIDNALIGNMYTWMYHAFEPFVRDGIMFDSVSGRNISRGYNKGATSITLISTVIFLSMIAPESIAEDFRSMAKTWIIEDTMERQWREHNQLPTLFIWNKMCELENDPSVPLWETKTEYRQFESMDRPVYREPDYAFSIAMYSSRIANYEITNGENLTGWHTADGMTYLLNDDDTAFADDYWTTVDRYRLPGTTVIAEESMGGSHPDVDSHLNTAGQMTGGAQLDSLYGVSCMQLNTKDNANAKKTWFMFGDEIVALGSGISSASGKKIETIVDNRKLVDSKDAKDSLFNLNGTVKPQSDYAAEKVKTQWAHLAGGENTSADIGYYFPYNGSIYNKRETRSGATYQTMWFDHGTNPNNASYAYVLLPGMSAAQTEAYASQPKVQIVKNGTGAQVVKQTEKGLTGAIFWNDSTTTEGGITSNKRAAVMMQETEDEIRVSVSDPTQNNKGTINIELNMSAAGISSIDSRITVTQLSPKIKFSVNVAGAEGASFTVVFAKNSAPSRTALTDLERNMNVVMVNSDTSFHEYGDLLYRRWASQADLMSLASSVEDGDRIVITHKNSLWFSNHFSFNNGRTITNEKPIVLEMTYRVSPVDPAKADQVNCYFRLWDRSKSTELTVESDVEVSDDGFYRTVRFILDPQKKQIICNNDGRIQTRSWEPATEPYTDLCLYLVSVPSDWTDEDIENDTNIPLETEVIWEFESVKLYEMNQPIDIFFTETTAEYNNGSVSYNVGIKNTTFDTRNIVCHVALYDTEEDVLIDYRALSTGAMETDDEFLSSGTLDTEGIAKENLVVRFYMWEEDTNSPILADNVEIQL